MNRKIFSTSMARGENQGKSYDTYYFTSGPWSAAFMFTKTMRYTESWGMPTLKGLELYKIHMPISAEPGRYLMLGYQTQ